MKIVIISDIHGNYDAWSAFPEKAYDELWVLGDLVNYGPQPREVVEEIMEKASLVVQGNHDYAIGHDDGSHWSARWRALSEACSSLTSSALNEEQKAYLRGLPIQLQVERCGYRFHLVHAKPSDPHYGKWPLEREEWQSELESLQADFLFVGHTHIPHLRRAGNKVFLNPGSIGQPRSGFSHASYAVWQGGEIELKSYKYPISNTVKK